MKSGKEADNLWGEFRKHACFFMLSDLRRITSVKSHALSQILPSYYRVRIKISKRNLLEVLSYSLCGIEHFNL